MAPFKKKNKPMPALYVTLNSHLEEMKQAGKHSFYCPLLKGEEILGQAWAVANHLWMELNHKNGNALVYRFGEGLI